MVECSFLVAESARSAVQDARQARAKAFAKKASRPESSGRFGLE